MQPDSGLETPGVLSQPWAATDAVTLRFPPETSRFNLELVLEYADTQDLKGADVHLSGHCTDAPD